MNAESRLRNALRGHDTPFWDHVLVQPLSEVRRGEGLAITANRLVPFAEASLSAEVRLYPITVRHGALLVAWEAGGGGVDLRWFVG